MICHAFEQFPFNSVLDAVIFNGQNGDRIFRGGGAYVNLACILRSCSLRHHDIVDKCYTIVLCNLIKISVVMPIASIGTEDENPAPLRTYSLIAFNSSSLRKLDRQAANCSFQAYSVRPLTPFRFWVVKQRRAHAHGGCNQCVRERTRAQEARHFARWTL